MAKVVTKTVYVVRYQMKDYEFDTLAEAENFEAVNSILDSISAFLAHNDYLSLDYEDRQSVQKFFTRHAETIIKACRVLTEQK